MQVQVQVTGPDARGAIASGAAFYASRGGGCTTLSASGVLLPPATSGSDEEQESCLHVLAPVSCLLPFIQQQQQQQQQLAGVTADTLPPGVQLSVLLQPPGDCAALVRLPAVLACVLRLPAVEAAAEQLLASTNPTGDAAAGWRFGWCLAERQPAASATPASLGHVALLRVHAGSGDGDAAEAVGLLLQQQQQHWAAPNSCCTTATTTSSSAPCRGTNCCGDAVRPGHGLLLGAAAAAGAQQGQAVLVAGSPFGCLAEQQFHGAVVRGCVSLVLQPPAAASWSSALPPAGLLQQQQPLFLLDARCLPGMEGGPVTCRCCGRVLGVLGPPLSNAGSRAELMLAVSGQHVEAALQDRLRGAARQQPQARLQAPAAAAAAASAPAQVSTTGALRRLRVHMQHLSATLPPPSSEQQLVQAPTAAAAAPAGCHADLRGCRRSSCCAAGPDPHVAAVLRAAAGGVVMVRAGSSWGSGVLASTSGVVLTVAHLFRSSRSSSSQGRHGGRPAAAAAAAAGVSNAGSALADSRWQPRDASLAAISSAERVRHQQQQRHDVSVLLWLPAASDPSSTSTSTSRRKVWLPARILHCFAGHLDLAVLQIDPAAIAGLPLQLLHPLRLADSAAAPAAAASVSPGDAAYVIGHGLFGPRLGWPPAITEGCVARVLSVPTTSSTTTTTTSSGGSSGVLRPSMVISTAAVHAGASGGALVNSRGELLGLVTSNARHASGATLPHLNFCIASAELRPVWAWAQQQQQQQPDEAASLAAHLADTETVNAKAAARLWALQPF